MLYWWLGAVDIQYIEFTKTSVKNSECVEFVSKQIKTGSDQRTGRLLTEKWLNITLKQRKLEMKALFICY